jgi:chromosome segregation ATPase
VSEADQIYGISMEDGESKIIAVELPKETEEHAATGKNN